MNGFSFQQGQIRGNGQSWADMSGAPATFRQNGSNGPRNMNQDMRQGNQQGWSQVGAGQQQRRGTWDSNNVRQNNGWGQPQQLSGFGARSQGGVPNRGKYFDSNGEMKHRTEEEAQQLRDDMSKTKLEAEELLRAAGMGGGPREFKGERLIICAVSGSGKSAMVKSYPHVYVDADDIFTYPSTPKWWENQVLCAQVDEHNAKIANEWKIGGYDGRVLLCPIFKGVNIDMVWRSSKEKLLTNLKQRDSSKPNHGQATAADFVTIWKYQLEALRHADATSIPVLVVLGQIKELRGKCKMCDSQFFFPHSTSKEICADCINEQKSKRRLGPNVADRVSQFSSGPGNASAVTVKAGANPYSVLAEASPLDDGVDNGAWNAPKQ